MSKSTIESITLDAFKEIKIDFTGSDLLKAVRLHQRCEKTFDSTIFRALRQLREDGKINYICTDIKGSQFRKAIYTVKALPKKVDRANLPKLFQDWNDWSGRIVNMTIDEIESKYSKDGANWHLAIFEYLTGNWNFIATIGE
jgi:hypothetical protein